MFYISVVAGISTYLVLNYLHVQRPIEVAFLVVICVFIFFTPQK